MITAGRPDLPGVTPDAAGVNVAVFSANATAIEFCIFEAEREVRRIRLPERSGDIFHGHIAGLGAGTRYGLRAHGPWAPEAGHRFNPHKLLLDPYAAGIDRKLRLHPSMFGDIADDSAPHMPKAIVMAAPPPRAAGALVPWENTVLYELHVRGFSMRHPAIPPELRGRFAALAHPAAIAHLRRLGITSVELMPSAAWIEERHLARLGLDNYWGYNPVGWMAPDPLLAPGGWDEVRAAVAALEAAGIETILDVVLNHSGEGDAYGPTLSLRGLDNASYYRLADDRAWYNDDAGCGNVLALDRPPVLRLALDALRAWVRRAGIHGFRFDLATTLARRAAGFDPAAPLLAAIDADPELRGLKLIAEPWDVGPGGLQTGAFPGLWGEWNDRFRDDVRRFWRGDTGLRGGLATRLAGSSDLFAAKRRPSRSINFVTAHDGFTLADLVRFTAKRNLANGEQNRDGTDANWSWNNGVEGDTDDAGIIAARRRDMRALLATLILARGTPMLAMGAEFGQSQGGNNNAYAQDNETAWLDWARADTELADFTARLIALRAAHGLLHADRFLAGRPVDAAEPDVTWRDADASVLDAAAWSRGDATTLQMQLADAQACLVLVLHRGHEACPITLPPPRPHQAWQLLLASGGDASEAPLQGVHVTAAPRSVSVFGQVGDAAALPRDETALLDRLAQAAGIAPEWYDVDGTHYPVSPQTKRALLAAMRLPAASASQLRDSLHALAERGGAGRALPFTHLLDAGAPGAIPAALVPGSAPALWLEDASGARRQVQPRRGATQRQVAADGRDWDSTALHLPPLPAGRYTLRRDDAPDAACALIVAPAHCHQPPELAGGARRVGIAAQLYCLRRAADQGIGDFTTLAAASAMAAGAGASLLAINPLHALFPTDRSRASPYQPTDRNFLDPLYIDVAALEQAAARAALAAQGQVLDGLRAARYIDYAAVWQAKRVVLEAAFADFAGSAAFEAFIAAGGQALRDFATFHAIAEIHAGTPWQAWPAVLRDPRTACVARFAEKYQARVRFHSWLQFTADAQFAAAARRGQDAGLRLGICRDLAVGAAPDGAEFWASPELAAHGVSIGAPPDPLGPQGQVWGLPPPDPHAMAQDGFRAWSRLLAANMRHAGALRIDHVMQLQRLFWVPEGAAGVDGAYVAYPRDALFAVLALESQAAGCLIIGEDLGTVPEGFSEVMAARGLLSYRVLYFQRAGTAFLPPPLWPPAALACVTTHDLPTFAGWRAGADIDERARLGLLTETDEAAARAARIQEASALAATLGTAAPDVVAAHRYVAATPCALMLCQADDLAGETEAVNLPGTNTERPNWRRRLQPDVAELATAAPGRDILAAVTAERPAGPPPPPGGPHRTPA